MGLPPVLAGAFHFRTTLALPAVPVTAVGATGTVAGVMAAEGVELGPAPALFSAWTRKV